LTIDKKRTTYITLFLIVSSFIVAHLCFWLLPSVVETWNDKTIDRLFLFRSSSVHLRPHYDDTIVHVDLNDTSIEKLNNYYPDRSDDAQLIRNLSAMNVSMILYDFFFAARSDEEDDRALIKATEGAGNVYFGLVFVLPEAKPSDNHAKASEGLSYLNETKWQVAVEGDPTGFYVGRNPLITFPALAYASRGLGYLSLKPDRDGVSRRLPLLVRYDEAFYPSFAFRAICDYLNVPPGKIIINPGKKTITLKDTHRPGERAPHDIVIPIDRHGNMVINFIGPWGRMDHYKFSDVLYASRNQDKMGMWKEELTGKIVVVSKITTGSSDTGQVPTDPSYPLPGLHANVMHTILTESFLRELSLGEMLLIEALVSIIIFLLTLRFSSLRFSLGTIAVGGSYIAIAALFFFYGNLIFHIVRPLLIAALSLLSILVYRYVSEEREKEVIRRTFEPYFPPLNVKRIMANPHAIATGGQKKELTILFSDIKDFTNYSASMTPDHIQKLLSEYFEAMTEIVFSYHGTVDKFIGDGLMVFFGDPDPHPDHALRCVKAAIDMQKEAREIRKRWERQGDMPIQIRIGINTGTVVVGNMGSTRRLSYTVLGSAVNLAERLEVNAPVGGILISQRTYDLVKDDVPARPLGQIQIKGLNEGVSVFEVLVDEGPA
jgi:adenylate cyclase